MAWMSKQFPCVAILAYEFKNKKYLYADTNKRINDPSKHAEINVLEKYFIGRYHKISNAKKNRYKMYINTQPCDVCLHYLKYFNIEYVLYSHTSYGIYYKHMLNKYKINLNSNYLK